MLLTSDSMSCFCNRTNDEVGCDDVSKIINICMELRQSRAGKAFSGVDWSLGHRRKNRP